MPSSYSATLSATSTATYRLCEDIANRRDLAHLKSKFIGLLPKSTVVWKLCMKEEEDSIWIAIV